MESDFLAILACPVCKGELEYQAAERRLICRADRLSFVVTEDGVPILLADEASPLDESGAGDR